MPSDNPEHCKVRPIVVTPRKAADGIVKLQNVCRSGANCAAVQSAPVAKEALAELSTRVGKAQGALTARLGLATSLAEAIKTLGKDFGAAMSKLRTYEAAVNAFAAGDGSLIGKAGLATREPRASKPALGVVTTVEWTAGKHPGEAILTWPAVSG